MTVSLAAARPPYVEFKTIAKDDPRKTLELQRRVTRDVNMAFIMQPGSKDQVERVAEDWLASIKNKQLTGAADAYPSEWVEAFHRKFEAFKAGQEAPINGTPVKEWPVLSPAQVQNFIAMNVLSVEDVAGLTEETMARFGMGCRELRDKARDWLKGREVSEKENAELKAKNAELEARIQHMEQRLAAVGPAPLEAVHAPVSDELSTLREQYKAKFGKAAHHKKSAESLRTELAA